MNYHDSDFRDISGLASGHARHGLARRQFLQGVGALCAANGALSALAWAGSADQGPRLRPGHAQTPEEARKELEEFKASYSDLAGWEKRKARIRQGILAGGALAPAEDAAEPQFFNKRVYAGYRGERRHPKLAGFT